ncbi:toxin TcdB middle/N-terminal domain-containing protein [Treponema putidum]|uniref:toxin TcdB middle/N-terminal domain-containing protein n=1 Tax=Treponema putidum TaxID=221027 RepID=UPI0021033204|nr:toxin TcdB middle/N-terminal domain-containing protein [Treponema putidum]UTY31249.1 hypothetical protein E4N75_06800 [Treponema putidum]
MKKIGFKKIILREMKELTKKSAAIILFSVYSFTMIPLYAQNNEEKKYIIINSRELVKKIIGKQGGVLESEGVKFIIPEGALEEETEIKISRLFKVHDGEVKNITEGEGGYRFEPKGQKFKKDCIVKIAYDKNITEYLDELYTYYYNENIKSWEALERVGIDEEEKMIVSVTNHFTDMINGTLSLPEHPDPVKINLNSIKELKAANAVEGVEQIEGLEGTSEGSADFKIALKLPEGTGGLTPGLAVRYSSGGGHGVLGRGFSLEGIETISIDTRLGLPKYDGNDTYIIEGSKSRYNGESWVMERESRYSKIENKGIKLGRIEKENNFFVISEKSGIKKIYGKTAWSGRGETEKYIYYLDIVKDGFGNEIKYKYDKIESGNVEEIRLKSIEYGKDGKIKIEITYAENREDIRIEGRGRYLKKEGSLIKRINSYVDNKGVRGYIFGYKEDESFLENFLSNIIVVPGAAGEELTEEQERLKYKYEFNYEKALKKDGQLIAFTNTEEWSKSGSIAGSVHTSYSVNGGGGGGIKVNSVSVTTGLSGTSGEGKGYSKRNFIDLTGDGIADMVEWNKNGLSVYQGKIIKEGEKVEVKYEKIDFDSNSIKGLFINENKDKNWSIGGNINVNLNLNLGDAGAGFGGTKQWGHSETISEFTDVNRDGYIDFVSRGKYYLNKEGKGFAEGENFGNVKNIGLNISDKDKNDAERANYFQEGIKAWRAVQSGEIEVKVNIKEKQNNVKLCIYNGEKKEFDCNELGEYVKNLKVKKGEYVYFATESNKEELIGASINASIDIKYKKYARFENMQTRVKYTPPLELDNNIIGLEDIYEKYTADYDENGNEIIKYRLKENYLELLNEKIIKEIISRDYYDCINVRVPKTLFENVYQREGNIKNIKETVNYDEGFKEYLYESKITDEEYVQNLDFSYKNFISKFKQKEKEDLFGYNYYGKIIQPQFDKNKGRYYSESETLSESQTRDKEINGYEDIEKVKIGRIDGKEYEVRKEKGQLKLYINEIKRDDINVEYDERKNIIIKLLEKDRNGQDVSIIASERNLGNIIDEKEYEKIVEEKIEKDIKYEVSFLNILTAALYKLLPAGLNELYMENTAGFYELKNEVSDENKVKVINYFSSLKINQKIYIKQLGNTRELLIFNKNEVEKIGSYYFSKIEMPAIEQEIYQIREDLYEDEKIELIKKLKKYEAYKYDFPYYIYDNLEKIYKVDVNKINSLEENEKIKIKKKIDELMHYLQAYYYGKIDIYTEFYEKGFFPVENGNIKVARIKNGKLVYENEYIRDYNGEENYLSGKYEPEKSSIGVIRYEDLYGGINLWYYGLYSRYGDKHFDPKTLFKTGISAGDTEKIAKDKEKEIKDKVNGGKINDEEKENAANSVDALSKNKPEALIKISSFKQLKETLSSGNLECSLPDKDFASSLQFNDITLVGPISSNTKNDFDSDGILESRIEHYAPYIEGNIFHSSRMGGSGYSLLPWNDSASSTGLIIGSSSSESFDIHINIGFGSAGINKGYNTGSGEQTQGYMDINGDGYPDVLSGGKNTLSVQYGNEEKKFESNKILEGGGLNYNTNQSDTIGGGLSASGSLQKTISYLSKVTNVEVPPANIDKSGRSLNLNANSSIGTQEQVMGLIDLNGDGLPDYKAGSDSRINIGDKFTEEGNWNNSVITGGEVTSTGGSVSFGLSELTKSKSSVYFGATVGANFNLSQNTTNEILMDINGDGLPDRVMSGPGGAYIVQPNTGGTFGKPFNMLSENIVAETEYENNFRAAFSRIKNRGDNIKIPYQTSISDDALTKLQNNMFELSSSLEFNTTIGMSLSGSLSGQIAIPIPVLTGSLDILINFSGGASGSYSESEVSLRLFDIDGDGLPDRVFNISGSDKLYVQRNLLGKAGLLKQIKLPQGGSYELKYERVGNTVKLPQCKYVLSEVTKKSELKYSGSYTSPLGENIQEYTTYYTYHDGYYDRETKEFYGFAKVTKRSEGGTVQETEYYNDKYYRKGMVKKSKTIYGGFTYNEKEIEVDTSPHARIIKEEVIQREKDSPYSYLKTSKRYVYDKYGNVTKLYDEGDVTKANDDITAEITYWKEASEEAYFKAHPEKIEVKDTNNKLLRKREGSYDSKTGALTQLNEFYEGGKYLKTEIEWTKEGAIKVITAPTGKRIEYKYLDGIYPIEIKEVSAKGDQTYTSTIEWDSVLGVKLKETDSANNTMTYKYDGFGRVTEVRSPYDTDKTPYAKYTYFTPKDSFWYTVTENKISTRKEDKAVMKTVVIHDGLGRINYTAKEGEVYIEGTIDSTQTGWNVSGAVYYDEDGRKKGEGQPVFYGGDIQNELSGSSSQILLYEKLNELKHPTSYEYDGLGRVIKTTLPDGNIQRNEYSIDASLQITKTTDPLENISISKKDARGNIKEVERRDKNNTLLTKARYEYSVLGEMLKAYDAKDNLLAVNYDMLGRRISLESLDMGRKEWNYDDKGRLEYENDSVLRSKLASIKYEYDGLDRIIKIDYPFSEDVEYEYGVPGEKGAGEVIRKKDETGETKYEYGLLNEVKVETRTIKRGREFQKPVTAVFNYEADYLGRMQSISYPDGEVLTYSYDKGGQLKGVIGKKGIETYRYVDNILYDEHSQRVYIKYGNGVETRYNYDPARRWLKDIKTENKDKNLVFQKINYNFDAVGNVERYINTSSKYETSQSYSYDALYQLIKAEGTHKQYGGINPNPDNPHPSNPLHTNKYRQTFAFDIIGNMTNKDSTTNITGGSISSDDTKLNYELDYEYDSKYAHRLIRAGTRYYRYDANGNITAEKDGKFSDKEEITFTYSYFAEHDVYGVDYGFDLEPPEDDPANLESGGTTTGGGIQGGYRRDYTWNERNLLIKSDDKLNTVIYRYGDDGQRALKFTQQSNSETLYFNNFYSVHQVAHEPNHEHGLRVSKHIFVGNSRLVTAMTHADNHGDTTEQTEKRYYYHADHLQSAQFITNARGEQYEHIEYTPYGELWIEETAPGIDKLPFRFTGKELDEETGLYYYGARYLDPKYSRWLSGDPAVSDYIPKAPIDDEAKKHNENLPGMGGVFNTINLHVYHYAGNNPIKYVDPDGKQTKGADINLHTPQTLDYKASMYIDKPNNFFIVSAHGSVRGVFDHSGDPPNNSIGGKEPMKPSELAKLIRNHPKYKKGMTIQLIVCNVGLPNPKAKGIPYAQQLADELGEGVKVLAPEGLVILSFDEKKFKTRYIVEVENNNESKIIYKFKEFIGNQKKDVVE